MILLLTGCSESKKLSTNQSEDNNQIKYKSKDITINENLLKENILVIKYVAREISKEDLEEVLKEVLAKEEVEEKYVRDFLNCSMIDRNSKNFVFFSYI